MGFKIKDLTRKSSRMEPAVVLSSKEEFLLWVEEHRGLVWGIIFLVLAFIAGIVGWVMFSSQQQEQAWELEGKAQGVYLDRPLDDVQKGKANVRKASEMFQSVVDQFPGTSSAQVSLFLMGNSLAEQEKFDDAIQAYTQFITKYGQDHILVALVQQRMGLTQLLAGDPEAAKASFQAVLNNPHALNKDQVTFELAKLAESEEDIPKAVEYYKTLIKEYPLSPFSTEASLRVKVLAPEEAEESQPSEDGESTKDADSEEKPGDGEGGDAPQEGESSKGQE